MMRFWIIFLFSLLAFVGCSSEDVDTIEEQREDIVTFLTSGHSPTLISQSELSTSLEDKPAFYSTSGYMAYRYIEDYYNEERQTKTELKSGDTITLTFWIYDFSSYSAPSDSELYYTNDPAYESLLAESGLNTQYWSFEPKRIILGSGDILKGVEDSLVGCREGDKVEIYLTYNMAYGSDWIGLSELEEPVAFFCTIDSIEN